MHYVSVSLALTGQKTDWSHQPTAQPMWRVFKDEPDVALRQMEAPVPSPLSVPPKELTQHHRPWELQQSI